MNTSTLKKTSRVHRECCVHSSGYHKSIHLMNCARTRNKDVPDVRGHLINIYSGLGISEGRGRTGNLATCVSISKEGKLR